MKSPGFNNATIHPVSQHNPHLVKVGGYWRVSQAPHAYRNGWCNPNKWVKAHEWATNQNNAINRASK